MNKKLLDYTGVKLWVSGNNVYLMKPLKGSYFSAVIDPETHELIVDALSINGYSVNQVRRICIQVFQEVPIFKEVKI